MFCLLSSQLRRVSCSAVALMIAGAALPAAAQIELLQTLDPTESGSLNAIGYDSVSDLIYVHAQSAADYQSFDRAGTFVANVAKPAPGGNDDDIEFASVPVTINSVTVPAGTLFSTENDADPPRIFAVDVSDGSILATISTDPGAVGSWVGGAYSSARGTFFTLDWTGDAVQEIDPADGSVLNSFSVVPTGATPFDVFFGDLDILDADGNIYIISSSQSRMRIMSPDGAWLGDTDFTPLGLLGGLSGIAFDDARGEIWMSSTGGFIYHIGNITPVTPCSSDLADDFGNPLVRDHQVTFGDFLALLGFVGPCAGGNPGCQGDIADSFGFPGSDATVDFGDFLFLLGQVGPCPE